MPTGYSRRTRAARKRALAKLQRNEHKFTLPQELAKLQRNEHKCTLLQALQITYRIFNDVVFGGKYAIPINNETYSALDTQMIDQLLKFRKLAWELCKNHTQRIYHFWKNSPEAQMYSNEWNTFLNEHGRNCIFSSVTPLIPLISNIWCQYSHYIFKQPADRIKVFNAVLYDFIKKEGPWGFTLSKVAVLFRYTNSKIHDASSG
jgi:hypothetical protein